MTAKQITENKKAITKKTLLSEVSLQISTAVLALREKLGEKKFDKRLKYFIQVNIGNESQKSGINQNLLPKFVNYCVLELKLNIIGLMCIPPLGDVAADYFNKLKNLNIENRLQYLSMGMSSDYVEALKSGSNFIRVGSAIFSAI